MNYKVGPINISMIIQQHKNACIVLQFTLQNVCYVLF